MDMKAYSECLGRLLELEECVRSYGAMQGNHFLLNSICTFSNAIHHERVILENLAKDELEEYHRIEEESIRKQTN